MESDGFAAYEKLSAAATGHGLACRGGFAIGPAEEFPDVAPGRPAKTLVLLGFTGGAQWQAFAASPEFAEGGSDPLDRWSKRVIGLLAAEFEARPLFPFGGPPWWPFQQWALRAESLHPSPLGILMHQRFGLWHAYRGALLLATELEVPPLAPWESPCVGCVNTPCVTSCPAGAVSTAGFDHRACAAHISSPLGVACRSGCLARNSCPVAIPFRYSREQSQFHMQQLVRRYRSPT